MTDQTTNGHLPTSKARQLRDLNHTARPIQAALNQAQASVNHAVRLFEQTYQRERQQILQSGGRDRGASAAYDEHDEQRT
jgi:hypothetical protein